MWPNVDQAMMEEGILATMASSSSGCERPATVRQGLRHNGIDGIRRHRRQHSCGRASSDVDPALLLRPCLP